MNSVNIETMVSEYRQAAIRHGKAKSSRMANPAADKLASIYRELRGMNAQASLLPLLDDTEPSVRCWAAAHALEFSPEKAAKVLEALAGGEPSVLRFDASMTLREWRAGRLRFP